MAKQKKTIIIIGGPSGTGKSTVCENLSRSMQCLFIEGDAYHPESNINKMRDGIALKDEDRWGWLKTLMNESLDKLLNSEGNQNVIVSCSMLKKTYRDYMNGMISERNSLMNGDSNVFVSSLMVLLYNDFQIIQDRLRSRENHFMNVNLLKSQFDILELPNGNDELNCFKVYCGDKLISEITTECQDLINSHL